MNVRTQGLGFLCSLTALAGANPPAHEQPPTMPWIRPVREITQSIGSNHAACASHVTRDGYTSIQVNVDAYGCNIPGDAANEPSIAIDPTDPKKIVIGWRQFDSVLSDFRQAGWAYSHDAGHTWVFQSSLTPGVFGSDPVLTGGPKGEVYFLSISEEEMRFFRSFDGGVSWLPRTKVAEGFWDKPWMSVDGTNGPGRGAIYVVTSGGYTFRSLDGGNAFSEAGAAAVDFTTSAVGPDSVLYLVGYRAFDAWDASLRIEYDLFNLNGEVVCPPPPGPATHSRVDPNPGGLSGQNWVVSEDRIPSGHYNIYELFSGICSGSFDFDVFVERSSDHGTTWSPAKRVNDDPVGNGAVQWFYMMSVAPNGRIDVAWNDTRNYPNPPDQSALSELYYAYSKDHGENWSANVPVSTVFDSYVGWPMQNKIGDYYHMLSDNLGVNVAYAATFNGEQDIYFLRIGPWDCNGNQIDDAEDIANQTSLDCNGNGVPDECEYRADFDGDGLTTYNDFATFLGDFTGPLDHEFDARSEPQAPARGLWNPVLSGAVGELISASAGPWLALRGRNDCMALSDIDHDGDVDLKDFYMLEQVFVTP